MILTEKNEPVSFKYTSIEGFFAVQEKYRIYASRVEIDDPSLKDIKEVRAEGAEVISSVSGKIILLVDSFSGKLEFEDKQDKTKKFQTIWKPQKTGIIYDKCPIGTTKLTLVKKQALNFPVGQSCEVLKSGLRATISTPGEVKLIDSSIFEVEGKGTNWRYYEVPAAGANGGIVAKLNYGYNGETIAMNLVAPRELGSAKSEEMTKNINSYASSFQNSLGLGTMDLGYSANAVSGNYSAHGIRYSLLSAPVFGGNFRYGGVFKMSIPSGSSPTQIDYTDTKGNLGYYKTIGNNIGYGLFLEFMSMNFRQNSNSTQLQSTQLGGGAAASYFINDRSRIEAGANMAYFGSAVVKSHMEMTLEYKYKFGVGTSPWWLGFCYESQKFSAVNTSGATRTFKENAMSITVSF